MLVDGICEIPVGAQARLLKNQRLIKILKFFYQYTNDKRIGQTIYNRYLTYFSIHMDFFSSLFAFPLESTCISIANMVQLATARSEEHTSELQSRFDLVCRLLLE